MTAAAHGVDGKVLALRLLREGLHVKLISDRTALMPNEIADVARRNGMTIDEDGVPHIASAARVGNSSTGVNVAPPRPLAAVPAPPQATVRPAVRDLLVAARASSSKGTVAMAARADALLARIRDRVEAEQAADAEREEKRREQEVARAEVERLKAQLAEAQKRAGEPGRRRLNGQSQIRPATGGAQSKAIRAWAAENGWSVKPNGRVPADVVAAWREATGNPA